MSTNETDELRLEGFSDERSLVTIAQFVNGYTVGWRFYLREEYRETLDIRKTPWVGYEGPELPYSQGRNFCFAAGHIVYDTPKATEGVWKEALQHIRFAVQVVSATPAGLVKTKEFQTEGPVAVMEDNKPAKLRKLIYKRERMSWGNVEFALLKNKSDCSGLREIGRYKTDQEKFVSFLQTGVLRGSTGSVVETEVSELQVCEVSKGSGGTATASSQGNPRRKEGQGSQQSLW